MTSRRQFLRQTGLVLLAPTIPLFLKQTVGAVKPESDNRILVVVQLSGGNDGLNTVIPFADDNYLKYRTKLRLPQDRLHKIHAGIGLHPSMQDCADLFEQQRLSIVQGVGYPNPNRSHDVSMAIWHTARFDPEGHSGYGWLGRSLDQVTPDASNAPASVLIGNDAVPVALRGRRRAAASFESIEDLIVPEGLLTSLDSQNGDSSSVVTFLQQTAENARNTSALVNQIIGRTKQSGIVWPTSQLAQRLRLISQLIQADIGARVYYTIHDGYDTHAAQLNTHARLLRNLSQGLKTFLDELAAAKTEERVVVLCFSEFGRQVEENASAGTDHGTAGPVFVAGSSVAGGLIGDAPDLQNLTDNAPQHTTDFRSIYATILQDWLKIPQAPAVDGTTERLRLFS